MKLFYLLLIVFCFIFVGCTDDADNSANIGEACSLSGFDEDGNDIDNCVSGSYCTLEDDDADFGDFTCVAFTQSGGACSYNGQCAGGLVCFNGTDTCLPSRTEGESCVYDSDCASDLLCFSGTNTCLPSRTEGESCVYDSDCASDLQCVDSDAGDGSRTCN